MSFVISNQDLEADVALLSKITLRHGDITRQEIDAILAPVPFRRKTSSMLDNAVRDEAGVEYIQFIDEEIEQKAGSVILAPSGELPCGHIFACITPKWGGGYMGEDRKLVKCFEGALSLAAEQNIRNIAIPIFLTGSHGYPKPRAVRLAVKTIMDNASADHFDEIRFVAFKDDILELFGERLAKYGWSKAEK